MQDTNIPLRISVIWAENAGAGYIRIVPVSSQIGIQDGAASFTDGFVPDNFIAKNAGGVPPFGQDFNGLMQVVTQWLQYNQAGGPITFDATFAAAIGGYPKGALLTSTSYGSFWLSLVDNNSVNPDAGPSANWFGFQPGSLYGVDTGSANAMAITIAPAPPNQAYLVGKPIVIKKIPSANNAAVSLNTNAFGAQPVVHGDGTALQSGELPASTSLTVIWDGANYVLQSMANAATALLPNSVPNAKLAQMANNTVKGNVSGGTATPQDVPISSIISGSGVGVVPIGGGFEWYTTAPPSGTLEQNGATLSRTTYPALNAVAAAFGYAAPWGAGDGSTTFQIPDQRGYIARAWDHGRGVDPGRTFGSLQADDPSTHYHNTGMALAQNEPAVYGSTSADLPGSATDVVQKQNDPVIYQTITGPAGAASEVRVKNIAIMKVMRYQ